MCDGHAPPSPSLSLTHPQSVVSRAHSALLSGPEWTGQPVSSSPPPVCGGRRGKMWPLCSHTPPSSLLYGALFSLPLYPGPSRTLLLPPPLSLSRSSLFSPLCFNFGSSLIRPVHERARTEEEEEANPPDTHSSGSSHSLHTLRAPASAAFTSPPRGPCAHPRAANSLTHTHSSISLAHTRALDAPPTPLPSPPIATQPP